VKFILALWLNFQVQIDNEQKKGGALLLGSYFSAFIKNTMEKIQKMSFWQTVKRFCIYLNYIDYNSLIYFICETYDALQPIFIIQITTNIIRAVENWDELQLYFWIKVFIILVILHYITWWLWEIMHDRAFNMIESKLTTEYMRKYIAMDQTETEKYGTWKLNNVFSKATNSICTILLETGLAITVEVIWLWYAIFLLATKSPTIWHFFWILLVMIMWFFFLLKWLTALQKARKINKEISMEIDRQRTKIIMSKIEILQNDKIDIENKKIEWFFSQSTKLWTIANTKKHARQVWTNILFDSARVYIYLGMWLSVIAWDYKIAYMLLLLELLRLADKYIRNIRWYLREIYKESINIEKLWEILDTTKSFDYSVGKNFARKNWKFDLNNITFSYWEKPVFQKFSLQIQGWTKTAFVGESWWWKTTLIKLLAGYIRADSWEIEIDGQKLSEIKLVDYYKHIWYLTQDPSVFDGTIYENLVYALDTELPKEDLEKVIKLATTADICSLRTSRPYWVKFLMEWSGRQISANVTWCNLSTNRISNFSWKWCNVGVW
jgi:ATP-binding cassette subfamily B protein